MRCPVCEEKNQTHTVKQGLIKSTHADGEVFWDDSNSLHVHDPNTIEEYYSCTNGHEWVRVYKKPCPHKACEWNKKRPDVILWP